MEDKRGMGGAGDEVEVTNVQKKKGRRKLDSNTRWRRVRRHITGFGAELKGLWRAAVQLSAGSTLFRPSLSKRSAT